MCRWSAQRYVFGKPLLAQAVIRYKLAQMMAKVEAIQAWLENVTYQMCNMVSLYVEEVLLLTSRLLRPIRSSPATLPGRFTLSSALHTAEVLH